jgi:hypothetical protein
MGRDGSRRSVGRGFFGRKTGGSVFNGGSVGSDSDGTTRFGGSVSRGFDDGAFVVGLGAEDEVGDGPGEGAPRGGAIVGATVGAAVGWNVQSLTTPIPRVRLYKSTTSAIPPINA